MGDDKGRAGTFPTINYLHLCFFLPLLGLEFNWASFVLVKCPYDTLIVRTIDHARQQFPLVIAMLYKMVSSRFMPARVRTGMRLLAYLEMPNSLLAMTTATIFLSLVRMIVRIMSDPQSGISASETTAICFMIYTQLSIWGSTRGVPLNPRIPWMVSILGNLVAICEEAAYDPSNVRKLIRIALAAFGAIGCIEFIEELQKSNKAEVARIQSSDPLKYYNRNLRAPNPKWLDISSVSLGVFVARSPALPSYAHPAIECLGNVMMLAGFLIIMLDSTVVAHQSTTVEEEVGQKPAATAPKGPIDASSDSEKGYVLLPDLEGGKYLGDK